MKIPAAAKAVRSPRGESHKGGGDVGYLRISVQIRVRMQVWM